MPGRDVLHWVHFARVARHFRGGALLHSLTGISFIVHVRLAAGLERAEEQFPLIMSPIRYRDRMPVIDGFSSRASARATRAKVQAMKKTVKNRENLPTLKVFI